MNIGYLWLFLWLSPLYAISYKTQYNYGQELYNLLCADIASNTTHNNANYVKKALSYKPCEDIYALAAAQGFNRLEIIKSAYFIAMVEYDVHPAVIDGMRMYLVEMKARNRLYFYVANIMGATSVCMGIYTIQFFVRYFRFNTYFYITH